MVKQNKKIRIGQEPTPLGEVLPDDQLVANQVAHLAFLKHELAVVEAVGAGGKRKAEDLGFEIKTAVLLLKLHQSRGNVV